MNARLLTAENRKWWTLAAVSFGLFMIMLDNTVVNVALPAIQRDLGAGLPQLEWIVSGYALTFAALMLTGGKLADLLGRRRLFVTGLAVLAGSSLACALAPSAGFLIGARIVQGAGAALMNPATLSIISATFPPRQRGTAIGIWAGVSALGVFFFLSLYMQNILGYSPVEAGAAFLPMTGLVIVVAPLAGRLSDRVGSRWLLTGGMTLLALQLLYFSRLGVNESFWSLVPGMLLGGIGMPAVMAPASAAALSGVSVDKAGVGSAVLNSSRQLGGSIGVALIGAIMLHEIGGSRSPEAFVDGLSVALEVAAAIAVVGALVAVATVRTHVEPPPGTAAAFADGAPAAAEARS